MTEPAVRPFTIFLTRQKYRITMGIAINTEPAANRRRIRLDKSISPAETAGDIFYDALRMTIGTPVKVSKLYRIRTMSM